MDNCNLEITFSVIVIILVIWYYFCIYKKGLTLSSLWKHQPTIVPVVTNPTADASTTVAADPEEFKNDISAFKASGGQFNHDSLIASMHGYN